MHKLVLASKSPRRKTILEENGFFFETFSVEVSEILDENLNIEDEILRLSQAKGMVAAKKYKCMESLDYLFLSADTLVVQRGRVFGKPKNPEEASSYLRRLSGDVHQVLTGFTLLDYRRERSLSRLCRSTVAFSQLSEQDIQKYVDSGAPLDKAGAYGIQDDHGFVKSYTGEFENIVGLPVKALIKAIDEGGWRVAKQN